mmetsp:Transcript_33962/g.54667  ORF Transcript_33962/g.54667 Transcript_33962/m.54667 type:complete len:180 (-) Transcript_33962:161-700(-)
MWHISLLFAFPVLSLPSLSTRPLGTIRYSPAVGGGRGLVGIPVAGKVGRNVVGMCRKEESETDGFRASGRRKDKKEKLVMYRVVARVEDKDEFVGELRLPRNMHNGDHILLFDQDYVVARTTINFYRLNGTYKRKHFLYVETAHMYHMRHATAGGGLGDGSEDIRERRRKKMWRPRQEF